MDHHSLEESITHLPKKEQEEARSIAYSLSDKDRAHFIGKMKELDAKAAADQQAALKGMHDAVADAEHKIQADHRETQHQKEQAEHEQDEGRAESILDSIQ